MTDYGKKLHLAMLTAIVATLVACGGGGGGGEDSTPTSTPIAPSVPAPATPPEPASTTPPTSTYAADSAQKVMFDRLNQLRIDGGFGALLQDPSIDWAAKAHADYASIHYYPNGVEDPSLDVLSADGMPLAHREIPGKTGFTGVTPTDRGVATGYTALAGSTVWVGEVFGAYFGARSGAEPDMTRCLSELLNTVFHRAILLNPSMQHIGIGIGTSVTEANGFLLRPCIINVAKKSKVAAPAIGWAGIYPVDGQTALPLAMGDERPDPAPTVPVKGYPVSLQTAPGQHLTVSSFTLKDNYGAVKTVQLTRADTTYLQSNEAYLVPVGALRAGTTYTATFIGTSNGTDVNRTWSFTTGQ